MATSDIFNTSNCWDISRNSITQLSSKKDKEKNGYSPCEDIFWNPVKITNLDDSNECKLKQENALLNQKLQETLEANKNWQAYDQRRDETINALESENRDNRKLIRKLRQELQEERKSNKERDILNQNQLRVYKEDFEQERRDRERAQSKVLELMEKLDLAEEQLKQHQNGLMGHLAQKRQETAALYQSEYERQVGKYNRHDSPVMSHGRLLAHSGRFHSDFDIDGDLDDCPSDYVPIPTRINNSTSERNEVQDLHEKQSNYLKCPKCNDKFDSADPITFLDHTDECTGKQR